MRNKKVYSKKDFKLFFNKQTLILFLLFPISIFLGLFIPNLGGLFFFTLIITIVNVFIPVSTTFLVFFNNINSKVKNKFVKKLISIVLPEPILSNLLLAVFISLFGLFTFQLDEGIFVKIVWYGLIIISCFVIILFYYSIFKELVKSLGDFEKLINLFIKLLAIIFKNYFRLLIYGVYYSIGAFLYLMGLVIASSYLTSNTSFDLLGYYSLSFLLFIIGFVYIVFIRLYSKILKIKY